jgi:hypothetical protein
MSDSTSTTRPPVSTPTTTFCGFDWPRCSPRSTGKLATQLRREDWQVAIPISFWETSHDAIDEEQRRERAAIADWERNRRRNAVSAWVIRSRTISVSGQLKATSGLRKKKSSQLANYVSTTGPDAAVCMLYTATGHHITHVTFSLTTS